MKRISVFTIVVLVGLIASSAMLFAAPKPKAVPVKWQLDIDYHAPKSIVVNDVDGNPRLYWYVIFTVANNTGQDRMFVPQVTLYTDTGKSYRGRDGIYPKVFEAISLRHNTMYLKDLATISGRILQGSDNSLNGVAIFPDFDHQSRSVDVFIGGLSAETAQIDLPSPVMVEQAQNDGSSKAVEVSTLILNKTLQVTWEFPGVAQSRQSVSPQRIAETWVMR